MIIKSMARKSASFGQVLAYVNRPSEKGPAILHNLVTAADHVEDIQGEFLANSRLLPRRKNGNALYHEVLSFGLGDKERLTPEVLEDLVRKYISLRAPNALVYAKAHMDRPNVHVHLLISANEVAATRRIRLSRGRFAVVKRELEAYQLARYPRLAHSIAQGLAVGEETTTTARTSRADSERERRSKKQLRIGLSRTDRIRQICEGHIRQARSVENLLLGLALHGMEVYSRGRHVGVIDRSDGRRYRFNTLGLATLLEARLAEWAVVEEREAELRRIDAVKHRRRWLEAGFREQLKRVLGELRSIDLPPGVPSRDGPCRRRG